MPEIIQIGILQFVRFSILFAIAYGLYRLALFLTTRFSRQHGSGETWDAVEFLYRIPSGIFGFLILTYAVICIGSMIGSGSLGIHGIWSPWSIFVDGMGSVIGIVSCAITFGATVFGIYQDYPTTRLKILGIIGISSFVVGLWSRW